ncbi:MAG: hypothetical protein H7Y39_01015, partial [Nitrospiraceae bacterium]|nr:hypothetical protein [Nitrospiraceae bacterium]
DRDGGGGSAQHWGRAFEQLGHTVKLMHPKYVKPYVMLIHGARAVVQRAARRTDTQGRWRCARMRRTGTHVAAVAFAHKNARVIWALLAHDAAYRQPA